MAPRKQKNLKVFNLRVGDLLLPTTEKMPGHLLILSVDLASQYDDEWDIVWLNLRTQMKDVDKNVSGDSHIHDAWIVCRDGKEIYDTPDP